MIWPTYDNKRFISVVCFISAFEKHLDRNYVFSGEMHNFWEMLYVIKGNVCVSADERVYELKENDIIFHKPMELHKFHSSSESEIFVMSFKLNGELTSELCDRTQSLNENQKNNLMNLINLFKNNRVDAADLYYE